MTSPRLNPTVVFDEEFHTIDNCAHRTISLYWGDPRKTDCVAQVTFDKDVIAFIGRDAERFLLDVLLYRARPALNNMRRRLDAAEGGAR